MEGSGYRYDGSGSTSLMAHTIPEPPDILRLGSFSRLEWKKNKEWKTTLRSFIDEMKFKMSFPVRYGIA